MSSVSEKHPSQVEDFEARAKAMKARLEQAMAKAQSPEEAHQIAMALMHEEAPRQVSEMVANARSWWWGFRRLLMLGGLALGLAMGLALWVEYRHAAPLCEAYAADHQLVYRNLSYPSGGHSAASSSASCNLVDAGGHTKSVNLLRLEPSRFTDLWVSFSLNPELTLPLFFVLIALLAVAIGKLKR